MTISAPAHAAAAEKSPTTCHWLPCTMDYDGMAPVHMYFAPQALDNEVKAAQLRGRGLLSVQSSPQKTEALRGAILQISSGGAIHRQASFENINEWHHEHSIAAAKRQVSQLDNARNWCQVARAVRVSNNNKNNNHKNVSYNLSCTFVFLRFMIQFPWRTDETNINTVVARVKI